MAEAAPFPLRDAHLHLAQHGAELSAVDLSDCRSVGQCLERVAARAGETAPGEWVIARRARVSAWEEGRLPWAGELDEAGGGRAVIVASFDQHWGAGSSSALRAAGVEHGTADPEGGLIERDEGGAPTGVLRESAYKLLWRAAPEASDEEVKGHLRCAMGDLRGLGFVEAHDMMTTAREARLLVEMDRDGEVELEIRCYSVAGEFDGARRALAGHEGRVGLGGLKLFTDGTLNGRTAFMLEAYEDPIPGHPRGTALMSREAIEEALRRGRAEGFEVAAHAIGDAAVRVLLDAYEAVCGEGMRSGPGRARRGTDGVRLRIEHAEFVDEADVGRFAGLGVVASVQPCHLLTDVEAIERLVARRAGRAFPVRELVECAGGVGGGAEGLVWFGSDTPVVPPNPRDNVRAAVHRRRDEAGCPVIGGSQAISEEEAWALMRSGVG